MSHFSHNFPAEKKPKLLDQALSAVQTKHYSLRTEEAEKITSCFYPCRSPDNHRPYEEIELREKIKAGKWNRQKKYGNCFTVKFNDWSWKIESLIT